MERNKYSILVFGGFDTIAYNYLSSIIPHRHNHHWITVLDKNKYRMNYSKRMPKGIRNFYIIDDNKYQQQIELVKDINPDIILDLEIGETETSYQFRRNVLFNFTNSKYQQLSSYIIDAHISAPIKLSIDKYFQKEAAIRSHFQRYQIYRVPEIIGRNFSTRFYDNICQSSTVKKIHKEYNIKYPFIHEDDVSQIIRQNLIRFEGVSNIKPYTHYSLNDLIDNEVVYSDPQVRKINYKYSHNFDNFIITNPQKALKERTYV